MRVFQISALTLFFALGIVIYCTAGYAQDTANKASNLTSIINEKYNGVQVVFQSPSTLILLGEPFQDHLWKALDLVKQSGYKIDAVTVVNENSSVSGNANSTTPVYTIFLSK